MLTTLLYKRCRSEDMPDKMYRRRRLGFLYSFSDSSDLREVVKFVNTGNTTIHTRTLTKYQKTSAQPKTLK